MTPSHDVATREADVTGINVESIVAAVISAIK